ncbi:hypothetical protein BT96DRAFT_1007094 [Gymnopus androsaceus JB14]|uniref:MIT domain-containing protein n=1 Tax=Gymnopus androsaceus JB14 TaxID=1447944 RepID=A0A6A4GJ88_9AGAR|nr:hypothetical protein BT96DRAFT_1007094 [Gymnopus androsaceus JB14]
MVKEEEKQEQGVQEQQDKRKVKQEALVPDLDVESDSLPRRRNSSPSSPSEALESLAQNSNPNPALPPRKRARLLTFKKVTKEKVAEVKEEEDVSDLSRAVLEWTPLLAEYKKVRVDADDEEIDFLTDPEWEDGNNGEDVVSVSGTHQESDRVETEVEAPREVEEEEILSKPEQVTDGMDLDVVPEGPSGGWQVPEQEEVDQLIDDGGYGYVCRNRDNDFDTCVFVGIHVPVTHFKGCICIYFGPASKHAISQSPAPAPIAMRSSTSTADGRPAARRSSTSGSTSAAKSTSSDALATTSKPKRARNVNAKSQEPATKRQLISSETASTPSRNSSPASAASSSSARADDKQTARAWLLQAKRAQDRNELPQALAFYQRAVSFVTALNGQLKDRCILDSSHRRGHDHSLFLCCIPCILSSNSISISDATATFNSSHFPIPYDYRHRPKPESRHASSVSVPSPLSLSLSSSLPTPSSPSSASLSTGPSSSGTGNSSLTMAFLCGFLCVGYLDQLDLASSSSRRQSQRHESHLSLAGSCTQVVENLIRLRPTSRLNSISLSRPDSLSHAAVSAHTRAFDSELLLWLSQYLIPSVLLPRRASLPAYGPLPMDSESSPLGTQRPVISSRSSYSSIHSRTTPVPKPVQLNVKTDSLPPLLGLPPTLVSPLSFPVTRPIRSQSSSIARSSVRTRTVILNTGTEDGSGSP